ncbi:hypothetical protein [Aliivibrio fischeri]|uniref:Uncharacterized protein n=1 Tax=Aliivibrio fischeri TaxID=668 RepID=A0A510UGC8_ALIFS|nr:hypothetical protein [Aliivibrio fischeri]GEK12025.1 hypothetical protein AFI02nite_00610 [Aliivibrio fischeri]
MMKKQSGKNNQFLTRAKLVNDTRKSFSRDKLPEPTEDMFDCLLGFKPGTRDFINLSKL